MATFTPTTNPMIIPAPALTATTTVILSRPILAKRIEWLTPITIGDTIQVQDTGGHTLATGVCEIASQSQILWAGPQKLTLPGKATQTASFQIVNLYSAASTSTLLLWF